MASGHINMIVVNVAGKLTANMKDTVCVMRVIGEKKTNHANTYNSRY